MVGRVLRKSVGEWVVGASVDGSVDGSSVGCGIGCNVNGFVVGCRVGTHVGCTVRALDNGKAVKGVRVDGGGTKRGVVVGKYIVVPVGCKVDGGSVEGSTVEGYRVGICVRVATIETRQERANVRKSQAKGNL